MGNRIAGISLKGIKPVEGGGGGGEDCTAETVRVVPGKRCLPKT